MESAGDHGPWLTPIRRAALEVAARTLFGVLWPERMAIERRRQASLRGVARTALMKTASWYVFEGRRAMTLISRGSGGREIVERVRASVERTCAEGTAALGYVPWVAGSISWSSRERLGRIADQALASSNSIRPFKRLPGAADDRADQIPIEVWLDTEGRSQRSQHTRGNPHLGFRYAPSVSAPGVTGSAVRGRSVRCADRAARPRSAIFGFRRAGGRRPVAGGASPPKLVLAVPSATWSVQPINPDRGHVG
jgi:hypothetical protein